MRTGPPSAPFNLINLSVVMVTSAAWRVALLLLDVSKEPSLIELAVVRIMWVHEGTAAMCQMAPWVHVSHMFPFNGSRPDVLIPLF